MKKQYNTLFWKGKTVNVQKTNQIPKLRHHKASGNAYAVLNGRAVYFGPYGTPEANQQYHQVIAEWLAAGKQVDQSHYDITINEIFRSDVNFFLKMFGPMDRRPMKLITSVRHCGRSSSFMELHQR